MDCGGESGYGHRDMKRESIVEKHRKRRIQGRRIVGGQGLELGRRAGTSRGPGFRVRGLA
jgi:hypothetical protein